MADYIIRYVLYWEVPKKHMEDRNVMKQLQFKFITL